MVGRFPGEPASETSIGWTSRPRAVSPPMGRCSSSEIASDAESSKQGAYLRKTDGSAAVHLGEGSAGPFSPDGKWALVCRKLPRHLPRSHPRRGRSGESTPARRSPGSQRTRALPSRWEAGSFFEAAEPGGRSESTSRVIDGGSPKAVTPERHCHFCFSRWKLFLSCRDEESRPSPFTRSTPERASPRRSAMLCPGSKPRHWSADGSSLLILGRPTPDRFASIASKSLSGHRTPWRTLSPPGDLGTGRLTALS